MGTYLSPEWPPPPAKTQRFHNIAEKVSQSLFGTNVVATL